MSAIDPDDVMIGFAAMTPRVPSTPIESCCVALAKIMAEHIDDLSPNVAARLMHVGAMLLKRAHELEDSLAADHKPRSNSATA